jgi:hypothetical protein
MLAEIGSRSEAVEECYEFMLALLILNGAVFFYCAGDDKTSMYRMKSGREKQTGPTGKWRGVWLALPGMPTPGARPSSAWQR